MQLDLTKLTGGQIAAVTALATVVAACITSLCALTVALVNAWANDRAARRARIREFRLALLQPYLQALDDEVRVVRDALTLFVNIESQACSEGEMWIGGVRGRTSSSRIPGVYSLTLGADRKAKQLRASMTAFNAKSDELTRIANEAFDFIRASEYRKTNRDWLSLPKSPKVKSSLTVALQEVVTNGFICRAAVERFVFD